VNIKAMLMRLESALNRNDLVDKLILWPGRTPIVPTPLEPGAMASMAWSQSALDTGSFESERFSTPWDLMAEPARVGSGDDLNPDAEKPHAINLVVGYNSSPKSHAALDLTLWIAHQTRLVSRQPVVVQVVYVLQPERASQTFANAGLGAGLGSTRYEATPAWAAPASAPMPQQPVWGSGRATANAVQLAPERDYAALSEPWSAAESLGFADRVLWQARCLANEWRGSLKTHLRFGDLGQELLQVVKSESADLLILGCHSANHALLKQWGQAFPCPVLGIPQPEAEEGEF
jgi:nucleotide-binding universal stress UspA family protein